MDEPVGVESDADVRWPPRVDREEDQVASLDAVLVDFTSETRLVLDHARHAQAVLRHDVLHQSTAVEAVRAGAATLIGYAAQGQGGLRDRRTRSRCEQFFPVFGACVHMAARGRKRTRHGAGARAPGGEGGGQGQGRRSSAALPIRIQHLQGDIGSEFGGPETPLS
jgi:hypothetical protein